MLHPEAGVVAIVTAAGTWGHISCTVHCDNMAIVHAWSNQSARSTSPPEDTVLHYGPAQLCHPLGSPARQTKLRHRRPLPQPPVTVCCSHPTGQPRPP